MTTSLEEAQTAKTRREDAFRREMESIKKTYEEAARRVKEHIEMMESISVGTSTVYLQETSELSVILNYYHNEVNRKVTRLIDRVQEIVVVEQHIAQINRRE